MATAAPRFEPFLLPLCQKCGGLFFLIHTKHDAADIAHVFRTYNATYADHWKRLRVATESGGPRQGIAVRRFPRVTGEPATRAAPDFGRGVDGTSSIWWPERNNTRFAQARPASKLRGLISDVERDGGDAMVARQTLRTRAPARMR